MNHYSYSCCDDKALLDISKMELPTLQYIDWSESSLWYAVATIVICPLYWNAVARVEYRSGWLSRVCGSPLRGCVLLAFTIALFSLYRDVKFNEAMSAQPRWYALQDNTILWTAYAMLLLGTILVVTSFWVLGFTGTFLGDYFGILLPRKVTCFPFNIFNHPMYIGAILNFTAVAIVKCSQAGLFLSVIVSIVYIIAILFEGPFTEEIYRKAQQTKKKKKL